MTAEQYRAVGPYVELAERLGEFAAHVATGNPSSVRLVYRGKIADQNTLLVRNAGLAGVLSRSLARKANVVNALQFAADRGLTFAEVHEKRAAHMDSVRLELATDAGLTSVEGAVVLGVPRLLQVDGIHCEAPLAGHMLYSRNEDVPGVIGYVGTVLGKNGINVANFSLGRQDRPPSNGPRQAVAMIETDTVVPDPVLGQLLENKAIKVARVVEFRT
jgi:D-3-phosphoglycerate dehydrogenase